MFEALGRTLYVKAQWSVMPDPLQLSSILGVYFDTGTRITGAGRGDYGFFNLYRLRRVPTPALPSFVEAVF